MKSRESFFLSSWVFVNVKWNYFLKNIIIVLLLKFEKNNIFYDLIYYQIIYFLQWFIVP